MAEDNAFAAPQAADAGGQDVSSVDEGWLTCCKVLGILWIIFGALGLLSILLMTVIFAVLLSQASGQEIDDAFAGVGHFVIVLLVAVLALTVVMGIVQIVAGIGILKRRNWGRILGYIVAALGILQVPIGTAMGILAFIAFGKCKRYFT